MRGRPMFKRIRIAILLYVLLFVAVSTYLTSTRSTDWDQPLWVNVYVAPNVAGRADAADAARFVDVHELATIEAFFAAQARAYGVGIERPFRFHFAGSLAEPLPALPDAQSFLGAMAWSLAMRWRATKLDWLDDEPTPDIVLFLVVHPETEGTTIERSVALRKGLIAVANIFAGGASIGSNRVVIAHELLHTLGATDKYDLRTNLPLDPLGYADPGRVPRYPQVRAELMAGRIPLSADKARTPRNLDEVVIGAATALEIGWLAARP